MKLAMGKVLQDSLGWVSGWRWLLLVRLLLALPKPTLQHVFRASCHHALAVLTNHFTPALKHYGAGQEVSEPIQSMARPVVQMQKC